MIDNQYVLAGILLLLIGIVVFVIEQARTQERENVFRYIERFINTYGADKLTSVNLRDTYRTRQGHLPEK